jgi:hypothetical protein
MRKNAAKSRTSFSEHARRRQSHERFEDCMGRETKTGFDETLPGELVLIVVFALILVAVLSLLLG